VGKKLLKGAGLDVKAKNLLNMMAENPFQTPPTYEELVICKNSLTGGCFFLRFYGSIK